MGSEVSPAYEVKEEEEEEEEDDDFGKRDEEYNAGNATGEAASPFHPLTPLPFYSWTSGTSCRGPFKAGAAEGVRVTAGPHRCSGRGQEAGQVCVELVGRGCPPLIDLSFSCSS